jgi:hypothetical protein
MGPVYLTHAPLRGVSIDASGKARNCICYVLKVTGSFQPNRSCVLLASGSIDHIFLGVHPWSDTADPVEEVGRTSSFSCVESLLL